VLAYYVICVIAEEFEQSNAVAPEAYVRASCFTKQIDEDQTGELRRSDGCPCGSGLRFGDCHGS
jgi:hypothetical protein